MYREGYVGAEELVEVKVRVTLLAELWREYCRVAPACLPLRFPLHLRKDQASVVRWMLTRDPALLMVHSNFHLHAKQFRHKKRHLP